MAKRLLTTIHVDGTITREVITVTAKNTEYHHLSKAVGKGGMIQIVGYFKKFEGQRVTAYVNEGGHVYGMPINRTATRLWAEQYNFATTLAGDMVLSQPYKEPKADIEPYTPTSEPITLSDL